MADMCFDFCGIQFFHPAPIAQDFSLPIWMGKAMLFTMGHLRDQV
jgi:hypothetical protein